MAAPKKKEPVAAIQAKAKANARPRPKPKARSKAAKKPAPKDRSGIWHWQTPDEAWKMRLAAGLIICLLGLVTWWSGEVERHNGVWRAGFRSLKGELVLGLEWRQGEWPHRWSH